MKIVLLAADIGLTFINGMFKCNGAVMALLLIDRDGNRRRNVIGADIQHAATADDADILSVVIFNFIAKFQRRTVRAFGVNKRG